MEDVTKWMTNIKQGRLSLHEWQIFNKVGWRWLMSWIGLKYYISLMFKSLLEGKDLECSSELSRGCRDCIQTHRKLERC